MLGRPELDGCGLERLSTTMSTCRVFVSHTKRAAAAQDRVKCCVLRSEVSRGELHAQKPQLIVRRPNNYDALSIYSIEKFLSRVTRV